MDLFQELIQTGGSDVMGMLGNQSGGAAHKAIAMGFNVVFPLLFFGITKIVHDNLDKGERAEDDTSYGDDEREDGEFNKKDYVIWGLYSIKVNLLMMFICFCIGFILTALWFSKMSVKAGLGAGGGAMEWWWKGIMLFMIITHAWSIVFGGLKSTAYQYFVDDLYEDREKMKDVCVDFGCGFAPHGSQTCDRGDNYRD